MFCAKCGTQSNQDAKFCGKCGDAIAAPEKTALSNTEKEVLVKEDSRGIIKCGNCDYVGSGESARSWLGVILAWLCVVFAPLITIIYFVATSKYRCPKCKSTFVGVKNKEGVFAGQRSGAKSPVMIFVWILLAIAVIGILASIVLVSLSSAREKAKEAAFKAQVTSIIPSAILACDQRNIIQKDLMGSGEKQYFDLAVTNKSLKQNCGSDGRGTFSFSIKGTDDYEKFSADCSETGCDFHSFDSTKENSDVSGMGTQSIEELLVEASNETNKQLPMMIDSVTQLSATMVVGKDFVYSYKLIGEDYDSVTQTDLSNTLGGDITSGACTTPETKELIDEGVRLVYRYSNEQGKYLGEISVTLSDCK